MQLFIDEAKASELGDYPSGALFSVTAELFTEREFFADNRFKATTTYLTKRRSPDGDLAINIRTEEEGSWRMEGEMVEFICESQKVFAIDDETEQELEGQINFAFGSNTMENPGKVVTMSINHDSSGEIVLDEANDKDLEMIYKKTLSKPSPSQ